MVLRMDGLLALVLWDVVIEVLCSKNSTKTPTNPAAGNRCETGTYSRNTAKSKRKGNRDVDQLSDADYVPINTHSSQGESQLYIVEDNEAVIKLILRGRSPTTRHVSRTHSGAIDSLYGRINLNSRIFIKSVDIKNQFADVSTKGRFTRHEWNHLLCLLNIMNFSMFSCSHFFLSNRKQSAMSKRGQEGNLEEGNPGEGSAMAKPKSLNLVMARPRLVNLVSHNFLVRGKILGNV